MRCGIYTRKSTSAGLEQEFNSLHAQQERCEAYIKAQGWTLTEVYSDGGFTGANMDRPGFQRLMADLEAKKIDLVLVYKVDRLSRSLLDFAQVMDRLSRLGASFVSVTQNFNTADAMGRLTLNLLMSFSEFERNMIAERTRDKVRAARRRGKWTGGFTPFGYDLVDKHLIPNEAEASLVRQAFSAYERFGSPREVAALLNASGLAPRGTGGMTSQKWRPDSVVRLLRSWVYAGYLGTDGTKQKGEHQAIVDLVIFERVHGLLGRRAREPMVRNPDYLLSGVLRCGACGMRMTSATTRRKGGACYRYYRCVTRDKAGRDACPTRPLSAPIAEKVVLDELGDLGPNPREAIRSRLQALRVVDGQLHMELA